MTPQRRGMLMAAVVLGLLVGFTAYSWRAHTNVLEHAQRAIAESNRAAQFAGAIHDLRREPTLQNVRELGEIRVGGMLEDAAKGTGVLVEGRIESIRPLPPQRLTSSGPGRLYQKIQTEIILEQITVDELMRLVHALLSGHPALRVDSLYLTNPESYGADSRWSVRPLVISYLVYEPTLEGL